MGISIIFIYNVKTYHLYRLQNNFINNFTHELKTPVTSLKLYLETFCRHEIPREKQLKYLNYMIADVNRLTDNIDRILNLARIESKSFSGEFVRTDIVALTQQFCENNRHLFPNCEIEIHSPAMSSFFYDINPPLFEMLLMNLLTNAVKYNESPAPKVDISFELKKRHVYIRFEDNGIGIEKSHIKKIFKKFYQVGTADNMSAKGSGIGLYLVDNIVRFHNGKIAAESGGHLQGTTVTVMLPQPSQRTRQRRDQIMNELKGKRILVIEDDAHIAEGIGLNLSLQGFEVSLAARRFFRTCPMALLGAGSDRFGYHAAGGGWVVDSEKNQRDG